MNGIFIAFGTLNALVSRGNEALMRLYLILRLNSRIQSERSICEYGFTYKEVRLLLKRLETMKFIEIERNMREGISVKFSEHKLSILDQNTEKGAEKGADSSFDVLECKPLNYKEEIEQLDNFTTDKNDIKGAEKGAANSPPSSSPSSSSSSSPSSSPSPFSPTTPLPPSSSSSSSSSPSSSSSSSPSYICLHAKKQKSSTFFNNNENDENMFNLFWNLYPRKTDKDYCRKIWNKKKMSKFYDDIVKDLSFRLLNDPDFNNRCRYVPHASTYLNKRRWLDECKFIDPSKMENKL